MVKPATAYIGLGSNLGDRKANIDNALKMLGEAEQIEVARVSDIVETSPLGQAVQPEYMNVVAELKTALNAEGLFRALIHIENSMGRIRREKWSSRTIDLDLLLFADQVMNTAELTVPHPQMHLRSFVLSGLCQLNSDLPHPVMKVSVGELAVRLNGGDFVLVPDKPRLISIAGIIGVGKTTLAGKLSNRLGCKVLLEPYDTNPFLPDVYAGKKELALDSQLYFLTSRVEQLDRNRLAQGQVVVSDYVFDKELIYARRLLNAHQLALYEEIYPAFAAKVAVPALVIYMRDSARECLERIHGRNRPYEQQIALPFLEALGSDYEQLFADWKICPVMRGQISELGCTRGGDIDRLADQIRCYVTVGGNTIAVNK